MTKKVDLGTYELELFNDESVLNHYYEGKNSIKVEFPVSAKDVIVLGNGSTSIKRFIDQDVNIVANNLTFSGKVIYTNDKSVTVRNEDGENIEVFNPEYIIRRNTRQIASYSGNTLSSVLNDIRWYPLYTLTESNYKLKLISLLAKIEGDDNTINFISQNVNNYRYVIGSYSSGRSKSRYNEIQTTRAMVASPNALESEDTSKDNTTKYEFISTDTTLVRQVNIDKDISASFIFFINSHRDDTIYYGYNIKTDKSYPSGKVRVFNADNKLIKNVKQMKVEGSRNNNMRFIIGKVYDLFVLSQITNDEYTYKYTLNINSKFSKKISLLLVYMVEGSSVSEINSNQKYTYDKNRKEYIWAIDVNPGDNVISGSFSLVK